MATRSCRLGDFFFYCFFFGLQHDAMQVAARVPITHEGLGAGSDYKLDTSEEWITWQG